MCSSVGLARLKRNEGRLVCNVMAKLTSSLLSCKSIVRSSVRLARLEGMEP